MTIFHPNISIDYLERTYAKAKKEGNLTAQDIKLIRQFTTEREATMDISLARKIKLASHLLHWQRFLHKPYVELQIHDVYAGINELKAGKSNRGVPFKQNSIHDYIIVLKIFLRWLIDGGHSTLPKDKIKAIKAPRVDTETTDPKDILTADEIKRLITGCIWSRDRAMIATIYETGCRVGELARLRWQDLIFDEWGVQVFITDTKTKKKRYARVTVFKEYLTAWKNDYHGTMADSAPVFINETKEGMHYGTVTQALKRAMQRAGITRHLHTHLFRKSRAVHMIKGGYQESVIKLSLWGNINTDMFQTYVRLGKEDIDRELLERAGVEVPKRAADVEIKILTCDRCGTQNMPTAGYCFKCGNPLTEESIALFAELKKRSTEDPEFMIRYFTALKEGRI